MDSSSEIFNQAVGEKEAWSWERKGWTIMINGCIKETLTVLIRWWVNGIEPDCATVASMLPVYSYSKELEVGRRVHALVEMVNVPLWKAVLHVQPQENAACCESQGGTLTVPIFPTTSPITPPPNPPISALPPFFPRACDTWVHGHTKPLQNPPSKSLLYQIQSQAKQLHA